MKRILLILFFISIINVSYGQTNVYHKFSSTFANWSGTFRGTNISNCYKYNYTLIGAGQYSYISVNKVYYPLSISGPTQWVCDFNTQQFSSFKEGWIREDTLSRKIYFSEIDYSNETLIYDFSLNIGDTLKSSLFTGFPNVASNITVTAIDSILIGDSYRKQWTIHGFSALSQGNDRRCWKFIWITGTACRF